MMRISLSIPGNPSVVITYWKIRHGNNILRSVRAVKDFIAINGVPYDCNNNKASTL